MARNAAALCVALFLAACAAAPAAPTAAPGGEPAPAARSAPRPTVNLSGYNAAFKEGYADGCESARYTPRRNAQRYGADTDYTMGWNDGNAICGRR
jgi:hypothetical protein